MMKGRKKGNSSPAPDSNVPDWDLDRLATVQASNRHMFDQQDGCDVTFTVKGPGDQVEVRISAHRFVLCSRSPVFYKLLWSSRTSWAGDRKLKENDFPADAFRELIRFLYSEEAKLTVSNVLQVLHAARKYRVTPLATRCHDFVQQSLTDDAVCQLLDRCVALHEEELVKQCLAYIEQQTAEVFKTSSFLDLTMDSLTRIVQRDTLGVPEVDLFQACVAWAHRRCPAPSPSGVDLRHLLEPLISLIRFPTMSTEEFATYVVPLNILNDAETCNIYKYFTCPERPPKRFLTAKRLRPAPPVSNGLEEVLRSPPPPPTNPNHHQPQPPQHQNNALYPQLHCPLDAGTAGLGLQCKPTAPELTQCTFEIPPSAYKA